MDDELTCSELFGPRETGSCRLRGSLLRANCIIGGTGFEYHDAMARATTVWEIPKGNAEPTKLAEGVIDVEKTLENWVEKHPDLLEPGLIVLARQLETAGGPLDLLCLDAEARLVVVELKRQNAYRVALAQVLDYAACVSALSYDELKRAVDDNRKARGDQLTLDDLLKSALAEEAAEWTPDVAGPRLMLVGTGADASLRRIVDHLTTQYDVPVNGVFFDVSLTGVGSILLVRSAVVADEQAALQGRRRGRGGMTHEELVSLADERGVRSFVDPILNAWRESTGRSGRPERKWPCWSLGTKGDGRTVAAKLYPWDDDITAKKAWLELFSPRLAADIEVDEQKLLQSLQQAGISVDENYIELADEATSIAVAKWITATFAPASAAPTVSSTIV
jgi:Endonuclease NucS